MFGFGKKNKDRSQTAENAETVEKVAAVENSESSQDSTASNSHESSVPVSASTVPVDETAYDRSRGPWDESEKSTLKGYVDFGAVRVKIIDGLNMRLDVEQSSQQLVAVTLTYEESILQIQAFAAPKSKGLWDDIRKEIGQSVREQGGSVEIVDSSVGRELVSRLPAVAPDGRRGFRVARFIGVDGPRWFLRGVLSGDAAFDEEAAAKMEDIFRSLVVVRGEEPMAPRDLLPMRMPQQFIDAHQAQQEEQHRLAQMPQRGPEIAEIR